MERWDSRLGNHQVKVREGFVRVVLVRGCFLLLEVSWGPVLCLAVCSKPADLTCQKVLRLSWIVHKMEEQSSYPGQKRQEIRSQESFVSYWTPSPSNSRCGREFLAPGTGSLNLWTSARRPTI